MRPNLSSLAAVCLFALSVSACAAPANDLGPATVTAIAARVMTQLAPTFISSPQSPITNNPTPPVQGSPLPPGATPKFNPFQSLTADQEACLRQAWGDEAFQAITTFQRPPTPSEQSAMDSCGLLKPEGPGGSGPGQPGGTPSGPGQGQPGGPAGMGPYSHQVMLATSADGLAWTAQDSVVREHASVPEIVRRDDGALMIYFVNGETDTTDAIRQTPDGTWEELDLTIAGLPTQKAWDPDVVRLPDGRLRLFFFGPPQNMADQSAPHSIYSAVSSDGLSFEAEPGTRIAVANVTDPSVVVLPDGSWLMALSRGQETLLASSADGQTFAETGVTVRLGGVPELFVLKDGSIRLFVTGKGIQSLVSTDSGNTWTEEPGTRLMAKDNIAADPSVIQLGEGSWLMAWKRIDPAVMAPMGTQPPP